MWIAGRHACVHANTGIGRNLSPKVFGDLSGPSSQVSCDSERLAAGEHHGMGTFFKA